MIKNKEGKAAKVAAFPSLFYYNPLGNYSIHIDALKINC